MEYPNLFRDEIKNHKKEIQGRAGTDRKGGYRREIPFTNPKSKRELGRIHSLASDLR